MTLRIGNDVGCGETKLVSNRGHRLHFPSIVGPGHDRRLTGALTNKGHSTLEELDVVFEGRRYFVGELARRESYAGSLSLAKNKIDLPHLKVLLLTSIALTLEREWESVEVVAGLPIADYQQQKGMLEEQLRGEYRIEINGRVYRPEISRLKFFPQAAGGVYGEFMTLGGEIVDTPLASAKVAGIDVGCRDFGFVVLDQLEFVDKESGSAPIGVHTALKAIAQELQVELGVDLLLHEVEPFLAREHPHRDRIKAIADRHYRDLALRIVATLMGHWTNVNEFAQVFLYGGGANIAEVEREVRRVFKRLYVPVDPQGANANGFCKVANMIFGGE